ncbi:hypothetical protein GOHSU_16_01080 [Gordonia hirsuta DSM 44140 = NBRC 16056]|uniref:Pyridoxamine 5'-phosphate oxidase N-terminal domain-containing protein n=1 Tax=Gordonia hirsuta DSM 44140 = NBRC 16056 TaxID=1121927 RepID=L7L7L9_9ACTN|nr:pyridoxamine 5'-phosphate oxidase family protein [Gordonia hirsuta]GAC57150.1 hypothetical protein GOHSU_16_01080 [Gordonia hirsuta DSM 44140 = NBRC 16056]
MTTRYQHLTYSHAAQILARGTAADVGAPPTDDGPQELSDRELRMLTEAFQFQMATVTPQGWPYLQYRSGPPGFVHHLGGNTVAFADLTGNRQYVSVGNLSEDPRVALFVADYPRRRRLKVFGRAVVVEPDADPELFEWLHTVRDGRLSTRAERSIVIEVEAFDWNCSRALVPQYTAEQVRERVQPYIDEITSLQQQIDELKAQLP